MSLCQNWGRCGNSADDQLHGYCVHCWAFKLSREQKTALVEAAEERDSKACHRCGCRRTRQFCGRCGADVRNPVQPSFWGRLFGRKSEYTFGRGPG